MVVLLVFVICGGGGGGGSSGGGGSGSFVKRSWLCNDSRVIKVFVVDCIVSGVLLCVRVMLYT